MSREPSELPERWKWTIFRFAVGMIIGVPLSFCFWYLDSFRQGSFETVIPPVSLFVVVAGACGGLIATLKPARPVQIAFVACIVVGIASFWLIKVEPLIRHRQFCERVRPQFESLAKKRPHNITRKQWENVVAWTLNAHGNCLTFSMDIPPADMARFEQDLQSRLKGPVDIATIDWIWDEIVRLTYNGKRYSDNWRPTLPERLEEFEKYNVSWGIEVE